MTKTDAEKRAHAEKMFSYPTPGDAASQERFRVRKEQAGVSHRTDITNFIELIDVDEKRM